MLILAHPQRLLLAALRRVCAASNTTSQSGGGEHLRYNVEKAHHATATGTIS